LIRDSRSSDSNRLTDTFFVAFRRGGFISLPDVLGVRRISRGVAADVEAIDWPLAFGRTGQTEALSIESAGQPGERDLASLDGISGCNRLHPDNEGLRKGTPGITICPLSRG
jgi:hypothetical protein